MKKTFLFTLLCSLLLAQTVLYAQVKPSHTNVPRGHQLYKSLKLKSRLSQQGTPIDKPSQIRDNASDRIFDELDRTCDPKTGEIPKDISKKERLFVQTRSSLRIAGAKQRNSGSEWKSRGPYNVGGRTRALAIDLTNENIILAGGVSGGLWRSENGGQTWFRVTRKFQNPSVSSIVQDPRPGYRHIWYYGGGEELGNSASLNAGGLYTGVGIYKSQDGGRTWELLPATVDRSVNADSPFDIVNSMAIDPINGNLYVATHDGVHRTQDGGNSFQEVLSGGRGKRTEIIASNSGDFYASIADSENSSTIGGVYFSKDGMHWTRITDGEPNNLDRSLRTIFAINPQNPNEVYMFGVSTGTVAEPRLYRYNALDKTFTNLTDKLPAQSAPVGGLNTQGGYNMLLAVHPYDPDFIVIGGTNLFRTRDGFRTAIENTAEDWIGGYSPRNDVSLYPDQHPDMHAISFFPSNPNKVLNANDGGLYLAQDITASGNSGTSVEWTSLNNGYFTTQPYAVSFDPNASNEDLLAGFQDNGTWYTNRESGNALWEQQLGGDGSYSAFADGGRTRYASSQRGNILRFNYDENEKLKSVAWVRPSFGNFTFITPFVLDPNDDNVMYLPAGRTLLRNSNLDEVPSFNNIEELRSPAEVNWSKVIEVESIPSQGSSPRELNNITALDVSTSPEPNKVYYGTGQGQIFRMDFADLDSSEPIDLFTGKGLPERGFISSIQVDPNNSDRVLVTFSNYNIPSVFLTEDAGTTWMNISGNLEENKDGTGNGPSVRWASFLGNNDGVLLGASTGLYYTHGVLNEHTVWQLENNRIGDGVVMQVRTRKDGLAALAVHGNGVFSKKYEVTPPAGENTLIVDKKPEDLVFFIEETPKTMSVSIAGVFKDLSGGDISVSIKNSDNKFIQYEFSDDSIKIYFVGTHRDVAEVDKEGETTVRLIATSGVQKLATEFKIKVLQKPILKRFDAKKPNVALFRPSTQAATNFITSLPLSVEAADIIAVPKGKVWDITRVKILAAGDLASGGIWNGFALPNNQARVRMYQDNNGKPGRQIVDMVGEIRENPVLEAREVGEFDFVFPEKVKLTEGRYWFSFARIDSFYFINNIVWLQQFHLLDEPAFVNEGEPVFMDKPKPHIRIVEGEISPLTKEWVTIHISARFTGGKPHNGQLMFSMFGKVMNANSEGTKGSDTANNDIAIFPNPVKDLFTINFAQPSKEDMLIEITDLMGNEVYKGGFDKEQTNSRINTANWSSGIYIIRVSGETVQFTSKVLRQ